MSSALLEAAQRHGHKYGVRFVYLIGAAAAAAGISWRVGEWGARRRLVDVHAHTALGVVDLLDGRGELDVEALAERDGQAGVAVAHSHVRAGELELVVLVPVLEREVREGRRVGELQVGQVPVEHLAIGHAQVAVAARILLERDHALLYLLERVGQLVELLSLNNQRSIKGDAERMRIFFERVYFYDILW